MRSAVVLRLSRLLFQEVSLLLETMPSRHVLDCQVRGLRGLHLRVLWELMYLQVVRLCRQLNFQVVLHLSADILSRDVRHLRT